MKCMPIIELVYKMAIYHSFQLGIRYWVFVKYGQRKVAVEFFLFFKND